MNSKRIHILLLFSDVKQMKTAAITQSEFESQAAWHSKFKLRVELQMR